MYLNKEQPATSNDFYEDTIFISDVLNLQLTPTPGPTSTPILVPIGKLLKGPVVDYDYVDGDGDPSPGSLRILTTGTYHISFTLSGIRDSSSMTIGSIIGFLSVDNITTYGFACQNTSPQFSTPLALNYDVCLRLLANEVVRIYAYNKSVTGDIILDPASGGLFNSNLVITRLL